MVSLVLQIINVKLDCVFSLIFWGCNDDKVVACIYRFTDAHIYNHLSKHAVMLKWLRSYL